MTREDANRLFATYYKHKKDLEDLKEKVERMRAAATKITPNFTPDLPPGPRTGPPTSKVEKYAIRITMAQETIKNLELMINATDDMFDVLRPHQKYLVKCILCNGMTIKDFAKREKLHPNTVRMNLDKIYKRLETV